jgi:hypothetical protein
VAAAEVGGLATVPSDGRRGVDDDRCGGRSSGSIERLRRSMVVFVVSSANSRRGRTMSLGGSSTIGDSCECAGNVVRSSNDSGGGGVSKTTSVDAGVSAAGGAEGSGVTNDKPRLNENVDPDASGGGGGGGNRKRAGPSG